jgi:hypothetical protein
VSILPVQPLGRDVVTDRGCDNWVGGGLAEVERGCEIIAAAWGGVTALLTTTEPQPWRQGVRNAVEPWTSQRAFLHTSYMRQDLNFYDSFAPGDDKTRAFCSFVMHAC